MRSSFGRWLAAWLAGGMVFSGVPAGAASLTLSPDGDDSNAGTPFAPLRSLAKALNLSRERRNVTSIVMGDGRYESASTIEMGAADSSLTITAAQGARPVLSGGKRLTGWKRDPAKAGWWRLALPEVKDGKWYFNQLFIDGQRAQRARTPNEGFFRATGQLGTNTPIALPFKAGDIKPAWAQMPDAQLVMLMKWTDLHLPIRGVVAENNTAHLAGGPRSDWMSEPDARYWIENVPDALDAPGEWYLDRFSGTLTLIGTEGLDPNRSLVVAPRLTTLVRIAGTASATNLVKGLRFRGITFADTDYEMPADGMMSPQAALPVRGSFRAEFATESTIEDCSFQNLGGYAIDLGRGCQGWRILQSEIRGSGGGGIRLGEPGDKKPDPLAVCGGHEIVDNHLHQLGRVFSPAVGVIIFQSGANRISHNEINDLYYTAISVGWNWGYQETPCRGNIIEFNHLHDIGQGRLSDMGGVYTLGIQRGTIVRNNLIHDVVSYDYGGWGLYPDEGSTGIVFEQNIVYHCKSAGFHQHYGRENVVRNNVFAFNREKQLMRSRDEEHLSFFFTNNIVLFDSGELLGSTWKNDRYVIESNVYFDTRAAKDSSSLTAAGGTWSQWQARGHDTNSVIADPLFVDAEHFDFQLKAGSPALKMGFRPIDAGQFGPRPKTAKR